MSKNNRVLIIVEGGIIRQICTDLNLEIIKVEFDKGILDPERNSMTKLSDGSWAWIDQFDTDPFCAETEKCWEEFEKIIEEVK